MFAFFAPQSLSIFRPPQSDIFSRAVSCFLSPVKSITLCAHAGDIISITFSACFGLPAGTARPILDCKRQRALSLSGSSSLVIIYSGGDNFLGTMPPPHRAYTLGDHLLVSLRKARQCHKSTIFLCTGGRTQNGTRKREVEFIFILLSSKLECVFLRGCSSPTRLPECLQDQRQHYALLFFSLFLSEPLLNENIICKLR